MKMHHYWTLEETSNVTTNQVSIVVRFLIRIKKYPVRIPDCVMLFCHSLFYVFLGTFRYIPRSTLR